MKRYLLLFGLAGCSSTGPVESDDTASSQDDTAQETGEVDDCADGPGTVVGYVLDSDSVPVDSGEVRLWDSSGSDLILTENVADGSDESYPQGTYQVVYGKGDYLLQAVLGACAGDEVSVSLCGDETQAVDLFVDCD